jgi:hypothetical protein
MLHIPVKKPYEASDAQFPAATHVQKNIDSVDLLQADTQMFTLDAQVLALQLNKSGNLSTMLNTQ